MKTYSSIKTIGGTVNLRKETAKAHFFHSPRNGERGGRELFLDKVATSGSGQDLPVQRVGIPLFAESIPGTIASIGGSMVTQTFRVAEGEIIKCFVNVRRSYGKLPKVASIFLRVRESAAYRKLVLGMLDHPDTILHNAEIEGTFDLLTTEEAVALGVRIPTAYRSFSDPTSIATVLVSNTVIREEVKAAVKFEVKEMTNAEGESRAVVVRKRRRLIG